VPARQVLEQVADRLDPERCRRLARLRAQLERRGEAARPRQRAQRSVAGVRERQLLGVGEAGGNAS
jgi:hypothetical protein